MAAADTLATVVAMVIEFVVHNHIKFMLPRGGQVSCLQFPEVMTIYDITSKKGNKHVYR